jgi:hypothetical protein
MSHHYFTSLLFRLYYFISIMFKGEMDTGHFSNLYHTTVSIFMHFFTLFTLLVSSQAFAPRALFRDVGITSALGTAPGTTERTARRKELLSRKGPFFYLDRMKGTVEFGSSAVLTTKLSEGEESNPDGITEWLSDGRGLALSIWDEDLMKELGDNIYQLQTMKLQFVTIELSPSVDMKMQTVKAKSSNLPVFKLQSVSFDPNIQILPGVGVSAESLGIKIEVEGQLRPTDDGTGVTGKISFATQGTLPPPMRLLPEAVLKFASDTINETVVQFAIQNFQTGARKKYKEYQQRQQ